MIQSSVNDERWVLAYIKAIGPLHLKDPVLPELLDKRLVESRVTISDRVVFDLTSRGRRLMGYGAKASSPRHLERRYGFRRLVEYWHLQNRLTPLTPSLPLFKAEGKRYWLIYWTAAPKAATLRAAKRRAQEAKATLVASWPAAKSVEQKDLVVLPAQALNPYPPLSPELITERSAPLAAS